VVLIKSETEGYIKTGKQWDSSWKEGAGESVEGGIAGAGDDGSSASTCTAEGTILSHAGTRRIGVTCGML
jgi:hypothetical protein